MFSIGIDVGGTFTDAIIHDEEKREVYLFKALSTPEDNSIGVTDCLKKAADSLGIALSDFLGKVRLMIHSSTACANILITRSGAKIGMLTTEGFRDIVELRTGLRAKPGTFSPLDWRWPAPVPLCPRRLRIGIKERVLYNGDVHIPLDEAQVRRVISEFKEQKIEAISVCFLFSFINPTHEKRVAEIIEEEYPGVYLSLSSEVLPRVREFERFNATVIDSYVGPSFTNYVRSLVNKLKGSGFSGEIVFYMSNGGFQSMEEVVRHPVWSLISGPAAGPLAGVYFAELAEHENVITADMGGTSFDVAVIREKSIPITNDTWIGQERVAVPMIDVKTFGAGGGSIAWIDQEGILNVGPQSAGASPGPACYGRGGDKPTVTDADLVLGYLNPEYFLGGEIKLDIEASNKAMKKLADQLNVDVMEAAQAIRTVVDANIGNQILLALAERGWDPREFILCAAGGMGPTHCVDVCSEIGIPGLIVPKVSAAFCAYGLTLSDFKHYFTRSYVCSTKNIDFDSINRYFDDMQNRGFEKLKTTVSKEDIYFIRTVDMRYVGQAGEIEVEMPEGKIDEAKINTMVDRFHERHESIYGYSDISLESWIVNCNLVAVGKVSRPIPREMPRGEKDSSKALKAKRNAFSKAERKLIEMPVYDGDKLSFGNVIDGPAIVEEKMTTIVIPRGVVFEVDKYGNYEAKIGGR